MQVILQDNVESLGEVGAVVNVRPGYARNYLMPRGLALPANPRNVRALQHQLQVAEARKAKLRTGAQAVADQLENLRIEVARAAGEEGKLFGSVTSADLEKELASKGIRVSRKQIQLKEPIKALGDFDVSVKVHPEIKSTFKVTVNPAES